MRSGNVKKAIVRSSKDNEFLLLSRFFYYRADHVVFINHTDGSRLDLNIMMIIISLSSTYLGRYNMLNEMCRYLLPLL
jgi:hypothetical protein